MNCPKCGNAMRKGTIEAKDTGSLTQSLTQMIWYLDEYAGKLRKKEIVNLRFKGEAYYCDECMEVVASLKERQIEI